MLNSQKQLSTFCWSKREAFEEIKKHQVEDGVIGQPNQQAFNSNDVPDSDELRAEPIKNHKETGAIDFILFWSVLRVHLIQTKWISKK